MIKLPKIITSSVIRSTHKGESHGGVYLIDLQNDIVTQLIDWDDMDIDWEGRGADRGLRGIAFYKKNIYLAASDEVFVYDLNFNLVNSVKNKYLKHCHEIFIYDNKLYLSSTGYDSILVYSLIEEKFIKGYNARYSIEDQNLKQLGKRVIPNFSPFDPNSDIGPILKDTTHINNVFVNNEGIFFSGTGIGYVLNIKDEILSVYAKIPFNTHNAMPYKNNIICNDTSNDRVAIYSKENELLKSWVIKEYDGNNLKMSDIPKDHARQRFGRGLAVSDELGIIIAGSSPATISIYDLNGQSIATKSINITLDVRNSIHGLEIWPFN